MHISILYMDGSRPSKIQMCPKRTPGTLLDQEASKSSRQPSRWPASAASIRDVLPEASRQFLSRQDSDRGMWGSWATGPKNLETAGMGNHMSCPSASPGKRENEHNSSYIHAPTFWNRVYRRGLNNYKDHRKRFLTLLYSIKYLKDTST